VVASLLACLLHTIFTLVGMCICHGTHYYICAGPWLVRCCRAYGAMIPDRMLNMLFGGLWFWPSSAESTCVLLNPFLSYHPRVLLAMPEQCDSQSWCSVPVFARTLYDTTQFLCALLLLLLHRSGSLFLLSWLIRRVALVAGILCLSD
jgi:hypothetical protein